MTVARRLSKADRALATRRARLARLAPTHTPEPSHG